MFSQIKMKGDYKIELWAEHMESEPSKTYKIKMRYGGFCEYLSGLNIPIDDIPIASLDIHHIEREVSQPRR